MRSLDSLRTVTETAQSTVDAGIMRTIRSLTSTFGPAALAVVMFLIADGILPKEVIAGGNRGQVASSNFIDYGKNVRGFSLPRTYEKLTANYVEELIPAILKGIEYEPKPPFEGRKYQAWLNRLVWVEDGNDLVCKYDKGCKYVQFSITNYGKTQDILVNFEDGEATLGEGETSTFLFHILAQEFAYGRIYPTKFTKNENGETIPVFAITAEKLLKLFTDRYGNAGKIEGSWLIKIEGGQYYFTLDALYWNRMEIITIYGQPVPFLLDKAVFNLMVKGEGKKVDRELVKNVEMDYFFGHSLNYDDPEGKNVFDERYWPTREERGLIHW